MKIVVLAGGISTERDVSFVSGKNVYEALKSKGHQVVLTDVYLGMEEMPENVFEADVDWTKQIGAVTEKCPDIEAVKAMRKDGGKSFFGPNVLALCQEADVVFVALHGENGENGKIQAAFDLMGIKYTCTDHVSSAICMDKAITKDIFRAYNIPTPASVYFTEENAQTEPMALPCVVKACCGGSSIGVSVVFTREEYEAALADAFSYDAQVVVEQYIKGREFSVGVIAGKALPIIEIAPITGFYDYKNKYQAGSAVETCPADLNEDITQRMQKCAEDVFKALRLKKYARMDFMLDENGDFYCLEANTVPGMTNTSLLPQEAAAVGISFEDLCQKLVEMALEE